MDLLLVITYGCVCVVIFKAFNIPLNKWSVPTAVLGGIVLIGGLIFTMNYNHPFSEVSRQYFSTTPIVPAVKGIVIEVPVKANQQLTKGDVLFRIDPVPFQSALDVYEAKLVAADIELARVKELRKKGAISQRHVDLAVAHTSTLKAQIEGAKHSLDNTIVRAPSDGHVTQMTLRPGAMAANLPFKPVMIFVSKEDKFLIGWYRQNSILRIEPGNKAEVAFDAIPGTVFGGEVVTMMPGMSEGQLQPSPDIINPRTTRYPGRIAVLIKITDERFDAYKDVLPGGSFAQTAIYSEHVAHVAIMRKILLRMASWMNYLFPFH